MQNLIIQGLIDNRSTLNEHNCWQCWVSYFMFVLPPYMFLCAMYLENRLPLKKGFYLTLMSVFPLSPIQQFWDQL